MVLSTLRSTSCRVRFSIFWCMCQLQSRNLEKFELPSFELRSWNIRLTSFYRVHAQLTHASGRKSVSHKPASVRKTFVNRLRSYVTIMFAGSAPILCTISMKEKVMKIPFIILFFRKKYYINNCFFLLRFPLFYFAKT